MKNTKNNKPKIIIDTDPGHDDALAILITLLSDKFDVLAVTTVAGNSTVRNVTQNAQAILNLVSSDVPVFSGLSDPLERELVTAVVHGKSGLAGFNARETDFRLTHDAPERIVELINSQPGEVTLLTLGPLSNVARAINMDKSLPSKTKKIVMMGGAINVPGNKNRVAEFNFFVDPEAAEIVFKANVPKVLVPLDACNEVVLQVEDFEKIKNAKLRKILIEMMKHFVAGLMNNEGTKGILVYDALAAYFLINSKAFMLNAMDVVIETKGLHTFGMSVAEKRLYKKGEVNVDVVVNIDDQQFKNDFFKILNKKG